MDEQTRVILAIASRVLSYPADDRSVELKDILDAIQEELESVQLRQRLKRAIQPIYRLPLQIIKELYVETFDLKEKAGLYLTAHELGDSRKRGMELIALQTLVQNGGFWYRMDELADYMPMLYEFLAHSEESESVERLHVRLAIATECIRKNLSDDNLYKPIFSLLMDAAFEQPTAEDLKKLEQGQEEADLDPMPFPLLYK